MKEALSVLFILIFKLGLGQNLVPNPSFEFYNDCPTGLRQVDKVKSWFSSSVGTPEYFNCSFYLNAQAHSGNGLVAIIPYGVYDPDLEYVSVKLTDTLKKGKNYCAEFYIQPDIDSPVLLNKIGAYFSSEKLKIAYWNYTEFKPQVILKEIAPAGEWTKVSGSFIATGEEAFINVGNFFARDKVRVVNNARPKSEAWHAYYYLDDFRVYESAKGCNEDFQISTQEEFLKEHIVYFESNLFQISVSEEKSLVKFISQLPKNKKIQLKLSGHTDSDATNLYNVQLSMNRVLEVEQFLSIASSFQLIKIWNGESSPLNKNINAAEKQKNRRVEISVIL